MWQNTSTLNLLKGFLPTSSELIFLDYPLRSPAIVVADFDGDGKSEIAAAYKVHQQIYIIILKDSENRWQVESTISGKGYNITYFNAANITSETKKDLVVGWQVGAIWSQLSIYQWNSGGFIDVTGGDMYYSKMDIEDMPGSKGPDGKLEIALWSHDTGEAYKVEVYRWHGKKLNPEPSVYPYYFKKVARYYESKVAKMPDAAFYWYYLADAHFKAGKLNNALSSIDKAISLSLPYPTKDTLLSLRQAILKKMNLNSIRLYPANVKSATGTKWGYINNTGNFIIKPQFTDAMDFQDNGLAVVTLNNLSGIINIKGSFVVEPKFDFISQFTDNRAAVIDQEGFKVINPSGNILTSKAYSFIGMYQNGRALFTSDSSAYGYLDMQGKEIIPAKYTSASDFKDGKAVVQISENQFALIDNTGKILSSYNYPFVGNAGNGLLAFKALLEGKYGYIDEKGNIILSPQYTSAQPFKDGRAIVNISEDYSNNKYGLIDKLGNFIIKPLYNDLQLLEQNRAAVGKAIKEGEPFMGSKYALADTKGELLTDFIFNSISSFKDGLASAYDNKNTFFIDTSGKVVRTLPVLEGNGTLSLEGDLIKAYVDNELSYFDKFGRLIWKESNVIPLNGQYKVLSKKYKPNKDYLVYYPQVDGMKDNAAENNVNTKLKELSQVKPIDSNIQLDYSYTGNFNIEFFKNRLLVLELYGYNFPFGAAHGMPSEIYPHIDLVTGKFYELKDLFKPDSDYVKVLSDIIGEQIKTNPEYSYVFPDTYKGIEANQPFYVNETTLFIYFNPYDIAPYAAGFPTFKIPYTEIMSIINTEGAFWKSFKG